VIAVARPVAERTAPGRVSGAIFADVIDVQMGTHHVVDLIDRDTGASEALLELVCVHHVLERARRARLVISDAAIG
jgi:hypothetical protein